MRDFLLKITGLLCQHSFISTLVSWLCNQTCDRLFADGVERQQDKAQIAWCHTLLDAESFVYTVKSDAPVLLAQAMHIQLVVVVAPDGCIVCTSIDVNHMC